LVSGHIGLRRSLVVDLRLSIERRLEYQSIILSEFSLLQVGNLGLLFLLMFFIFAALGMELFGQISE